MTEHAAKPVAEEIVHQEYEDDERQPDPHRAPHGLDRQGQDQRREQDVIGRQGIEQRDALRDDVGLRHEIDPGRGRKKRQPPVEERDPLAVGVRRRTDQHECQDQHQRQERHDEREGVGARKRRRIDGPHGRRGRECLYGMARQATRRSACPGVEENAEHWLGAIF